MPMLTRANAFASLEEHFDQIAAVKDGEDCQRGDFVEGIVHYLCFLNQFIVEGCVDKKLALYNRLYLSYIRQTNFLLKLL